MTITQISKIPVMTDNNLSPKNSLESSAILNYQTVKSVKGTKRNVVVFNIPERMNVTVWYTDSNIMWNKINRKRRMIQASIRTYTMSVLRPQFYSNLVNRNDLKT